ncbi:hypothetical protein SMICM17S_04039 [Streptomyces microflavus]
MQCVALCCVGNLWSPAMQKISFSASGWETWDVARQPLIREQMPVLIDDDLLFEDAPGSPRPTTVANRYLAELPINGAPAVRTWENSAGCLSAWLTFLQERGVHPFADRRELRGALSMYTEYRLVGPLKARWDHTTWNLHVSILSAFYDWGEGRGCAQRRALHLPRGAPWPTASWRRSRRTWQSWGALGLTRRSSIWQDFAELFVRALAGLDPLGEPDLRYRRPREGARNAAMGWLRTVQRAEAGRSSPT